MGRVAGRLCGSVDYIVRSPGSPRRCFTTSMKRKVCRFGGKGFIRRCDVRGDPLRSDGNCSACVHVGKLGFSGSGGL